jgi:phosphatidylinositol alpha-1,6-mannosyltransferase
MNATQPSRNGRFAVLSDIFPPINGGSGRWFYEVYRRFEPGTVTFITGDHDGGADFDRDHDDLDINRVDLTLADWGTVRPWSCLRYLRLLGKVHRITRAKTISKVHAARVLPEGWITYLLKLRNVSTTLRQHLFVISVGTQCCRGPAPDPPGFS